MIVQLTIRDNLIYSFSFSNFCLNPLTPLSRFTFSLTAILSAPSCPCAPALSTHCATAVMICGGSSCSRAEAHISCPRGLLSAPVTVAFTDPVPAWACPALCGSFHFWKLYVMCALCFSFSVFFAVVSFLQLMASDSRSRARPAMECGPLWEREKGEGGDDARQARDVCINFLTPPKSPDCVH